MDPCQVIKKGWNMQGMGVNCFIILIKELTESISISNIL
jgi:hypothetical protein